MNNEPKPRDKNPAAITFVCLIVGLLPIAIFLIGLTANNAAQPPDFGFLLTLCILCNLLGAFGCVRNVKNGAGRFFLGLLLAFGFFVVSTVVGVFLACARSMS